MSQFVPSPHAEHVLRAGRIIDHDETPAHMVKRVTAALADQEAEFSGRRSAAQFAEAFEAALDRREIIMSTPVMMNAGRHPDRPLTACTVPTADLDPARSGRLREEVITLHEQGMGTGFNLDTAEDPVATLRFLNRVAVDSAQQGREERPVGNMAIVSVRHPRIHEFIQAKVSARADDTDWKFNISINVDDAFMAAVDGGWDVELLDGCRVDPSRLFDDICTAAAVCADPGIVFLERASTKCSNASNSPTTNAKRSRATGRCSSNSPIDLPTSQRLPDRRPANSAQTKRSSH
ncbi:ribonucleotide reductase N-terminal alpha domain-containing protein [Nocardia sp. alder85J]|uniref:ribonucleotide reductase N-terminal alpha domain-containing protein n=1 Tax=Nocardia sp. alder85J TaxID=2862949 RepID=UPI00224E4FA3|nr:ribonucleotide reductase N-terminal alpha domain-containing protein [Nocardia sp. alder85J]MCX4092500.1 hypothetical protein [Nocardia sp. alder85J]